MTKTAPKITSTPTTTDTANRNGSEVFIPLHKLKKSPKNARKIAHSAASIEAKAASIKAKGILQNLVVEPELNASGVETGFFLVTIGEGRRLAQMLRVKRKEIKKTEPMRCVIDTTNDAQEISLDENVTREAMHPADQFEAFHHLSERMGWGAEEIAARFGVTAQVVRQRLRLAAVSPRLMQLYRDGDMALDELMAFAVVDDAARQEEVYDNLSDWNRDDPRAIRSALLETHVKATERRAVFVGAEAYTAAGGTILRDLFTEDKGGFFEDATLLDRLVMEKLEILAAPVRAEGWKWVSLSIDFPHSHGMRRSRPQHVDLSDEEEAAYAAARDAYDLLSEQYSDDGDELPGDVMERMAGFESDMERLDAKRMAYAAADVARSGAILSVAHNGTVRIERGFVRPGDEVREPEEEGSEDGGETATRKVPLGTGLPDSLVRDLTAHKTLAMRFALGEQPDAALIAVTHTFAVQTFYRGTNAHCLDLRMESVELRGFAHGIDDTTAAKLIAERHGAWALKLPHDVADLWSFVAELDQPTLLELLAHCASLTVNAVQQPSGIRAKALATADRLAAAVRLDMADYWSPKENGYLARVTKPQILAAVREGVNDTAANRLADMKKATMAEAAGELLTGTRWLPALLKTSVVEEAEVQAAAAA